MFSSDLSEDQLKQRLGHMASTPCQVKWDPPLSLSLSNQLPIMVVEIVNDIYFDTIL